MAEWGVGANVAILAIAPRPADVTVATVTFLLPFRSRVNVYDMPRLVSIGSAVSFHGALGKASGGGSPVDVSSRIAPPYDVLDEGPKQALLAKDACNVVKIDLPVTPPKTVGPDEAYASAGDVFRAWLADGTLSPVRGAASGGDGAAAAGSDSVLVAYEQVFTMDGHKRRRRGFFTALQAEEFGRAGGGIHRHELTIKAGTDDRLKLMEATDAQLSPVFGMYNDAAGAVSELLGDVYAREPDFCGRTENDDVEHRCWVIDSPETFASMRDVFATKDVYIADGHHRYTTALNYTKSHEHAHGGACLFVLISTTDPGMVVKPYMRILRGLAPVDMGALEKALPAVGYKIAPCDGPDVLDTTEGKHPFVLYDGKTERHWLLTTDAEDPLADVPDFKERPRAWRTLDVAVLHNVIIDGAISRVLGKGDGNAVDFAFAHEQSVVYEQTKAAAEGEGRIGIFLRHTPLKAVCDVSDASDVMPIKSTFFFPKLATGLLMLPWKHATS